MKQLDSVTWGDVGFDSNPRQWLIGAFIAKDSPLHDQTLEVKFGSPYKGEERTEVEATADPERRSLMFVISGQMEFGFPAAENQRARKLTLEPGEYVLWEPGILHYWKALSNSEVITIRWRSKP